MQIHLITEGEKKRCQGFQEYSLAACDNWRQMQGHYSGMDSLPHQGK